MTSRLFNLACLMRYSPGSLMAGKPASATKATENPSFNFPIINSILISELNSLKLISLFFMSRALSNFFVCLVSSQAIKDTLLRIFFDLEEMSLRLPIGVPTI